ncbi:MAG TPA: serine/threonine-protein kinase [Chthoniobacteraceae bacterium]
MRKVQHRGRLRLGEVTDAPRHNSSADDELPTLARRSVSLPGGPAAKFAHYEVEQREDGSPWELGRGGMGVTYKARDTNLRCPVALKVINPACLTPENRSRFVREARSAAQIRHPNVASVFHLGSTADQYFYAMEYIAGETAQAWVQQKGPMRPELALRIVAQAASALAAAARENLVHRDIKPGNLMILPNPDHDQWPLVKLIDFGLVRDEFHGLNQTLATAGFVGTPQFASPEQAEERELDVRSDIYSLGCSLWFLLTGRPPFNGSLASIFADHLRSEPPWDRLEGIPAPVRRLLKRMLRKDPARRPQTPVELRAEIEQCLALIERREHLMARMRKPLRVSHTWLATRPRARAAIVFAGTPLLIFAFIAWLIPQSAGDSSAPLAKSPIPGIPEQTLVPEPVPENTGGADANSLESPQVPPEASSADRHAGVAEPPRAPDDLVPIAAEPVPAEAAALLEPNREEAAAPELASATATEDQAGEPFSLEVTNPPTPGFDLSDPEQTAPLTLSGGRETPVPTRTAKRSGNSSSRQTSSRSTRRADPVRPLKKIHRTMESFIRRVF